MANLTLAVSMIRAGSGSGEGGQGLYKGGNAAPPSPWAIQVCLPRHTEMGLPRSGLDSSVSGIQKFLKPLRAQLLPWA